MTILIATNMPMENRDKLLKDIATEMHQLIDYTKDIKFIVNRNRLLIEYGDFIVDIRPAKYEKLAGIRFDYFLTDNDDAAEYLFYHYKGNDEHYGKLNDTADIIKLFMEYLEEVKKNV